MSSIIFDLDGTLWDASGTSAKGWTSALEKLNLSQRKLSSEDIKKISGLPFEECVKILLPELDEHQFQIFCKEMDSHERILIEKEGGRLYEGVLESIPLLKQHYELFIVSNCQDWYLEAFLNFSKLRSFFKDCECHGRTRLSKAENILEIIQRNQLQKAVYVGDRKEDFEATQKAGVDFFYARYGFGKLSNDFQAFDSFKELAHFFIRRKIGKRE